MALNVQLNWQPFHDFPPKEENRIAFRRSKVNPQKTHTQNPTQKWESFFSIPFAPHFAFCGANRSFLMEIASPFPSLDGWIFSFGFLSFSLQLPFYFIHLEILFLAYDKNRGSTQLKWFEVNQTCTTRKCNTALLIYSGTITSKYDGLRVRGRGGCIGIHWCGMHFYAASGFAWKFKSFQRKCGNISCAK